MDEENLKSLSLEYNVVNNSDKLSKLIDKYIIPQALEKKQNAEVTTPYTLRQEMLNTIPTDFWTTPKKVFEPCSGKGGFVLDIVSRFMDGLKDLILDENERYRVIVEECLYWCDINPTNVFICKLLLDPYNQYSLKYHEGNTLELDISLKWGIEGFNLVVGNPPYNIPKENVLKGGYGGRSLWDKFVIKSFDSWIKENGYLVYVHPPSWRKPEHYLWNLMSSKQIVFLKTFSKKDGLKIFGCSTLVDYYLIENRPVYKNTIIHGQDNKIVNIDINEWNFLPSGCFEEIKNILGTNQVIYSRSLYGTDKKNIKMKPIDDFVLPVVHNMTKKDGLGFVYSKEDKGQFGVKKVILSFGRHQYPYNDWKGEYGMSQICYGLEIENEEEGEKIVNAIKSDKFKDILKYTKWSTFQTDWRMFKYFKKDFWKEFQ